MFVALFFALLQPLLAQPDRFGLPACSAPDQELADRAAFDSDYRNTGFSPGPLVPAADLAWNEEALRDSFLLSNVIPQNLSLNAGKWSRLESAVRKLAAYADSLNVISGPIYCAIVERIGVSQLFQVVLSIRGDELRMYAAILPNGPNPSRPLNEFAMSVEEVSCRTGLTFFPQLPTSLQLKLESEVSQIQP